MVTPENAVAKHTIAVYDELVKRATTNDNDELVYNGNITEVFNYLGISTSMYSRVRKVLVESRSIEFLQRGNVAQPSIVLLLGEPSVESLGRKDLTQARRLDKVVGELEKRVAALEAVQAGIPANVSQALWDHESRLNELEKNATDGESEP